MSEIKNREEIIAKRQLRRLYDSYKNTINGDLRSHYKEQANIIKEDLKKLRRNKKNVK